MDCLFCKIAKGEIPSKIIYRDDLIVVFDDISPQAPHHKIIIPQKHINSVNDLHAEDSELVGYMVQTASMLAKQLDMAENGYRLVINCNPAGGQTVFHLHLHLLGGRQMTWPPG